MFTRLRLSAFVPTGDWKKDGREVVNWLSEYFLSLEKKGALSITEAQITASQGIKFPATQVPSTDPNTLDDYDELLWTPVGNGITFTSASGDSTKWGREFVAHFDVTWPVTADAGEARITGLPYTVANVGRAQGGFLSYTDYGTPILVRGFAGTTYGVLLDFNGTTLTNAQASGKRFVGAVMSHI